MDYMTIYNLLKDFKNLKEHHISSSESIPNVHFS